MSTKQLLTQVKTKIFSNKMMRNGVLCVVGYIVNKSIAFLMTPIFTRIMSPEEYGNVSTYTAWLGVLAYVVGLSLDYTVRNAYVDYKDDLDGYVSSLYGLSMVSFICLSVILFLVNKFVLKQSSDLLCIFCLVHAFFYAIVHDMMQKCTMQGKYKARVALLALPNILSSLAGVIFVICMEKDKHIGRIIGYLVVFIPIGIALIVFQRFKGKRFYNKTYWKYGLVLSLPMIFHGLSVTALSSVNRIFITNFRGAAETAVYGVVATFSMMMIAIMTAIENIWIPWFTDKMEEKKFEEINSKVIKYIELIAVVVAGVLMVSPELLKIMTPESYWHGQYILAPMVVASYVMFLYSLSVGLELYYKSNKIVALNTVVAVLVNIVLGVIFIPLAGMHAAAYIMLASYLVLFVLHIINAKKLNSAVFPMKSYLLPSAFVIGLAVLSVLTAELWYLRWALAAIIAIAYMYIFLTKEMKKE